MFPRRFFAAVHALLGRAGLAHGRRLQEGKPMDDKLEEENARQPFDHTAKPIHKVFAEITAKVPPEALAELPTDAAANHDQYLYGD